jgi:plasmid stability protein
MSSEGYVANITVRGLDADTKARLRVRAARHGRSMEAEVRAILREALSESSPAPSTGLGSRIHARFAALGGAELELPLRSERPRAAVFE